MTEASSIECRGKRGIMGRATPLAALRQMRFDRLVLRIASYKFNLAKRLDKTRKLFGRKVLAVDIHTHSNYSDGRGTVEQNHACMKNAGLDFIFITDHNSIGQKRAVSKWAKASWGQEPGIRDVNSDRCLHHIGLLCGKSLFRPQPDSVAANFNKANELAPFVWVPHPVGYPGNWYEQDSIRALWSLGKVLAIEVMNGAGKIVRSYDDFDRKAVAVWDQLLCDGKRVTALGASDAHMPDDIGTAWTGVFAARCRDNSIIKALNQGRCFASEASLIDFSCDGQPMGATIRKKKGGILRLDFRVADSVGLASVRIVSQGKVVKEVQAKNQGLVNASWCQRMPAKATYFRLESTASDDRRAFSTPVYVEPRS